MPEMDGYEVLRALRATPAVARGKSVVVMTAKPLSHDEQEALLTLGARAICANPLRSIRCSRSSRRGRQRR